MQDTKLQEIGKAAYAGIANMVSALQCDYDRLEELREERDSHANELPDSEFPPCHCPSCGCGSYTATYLEMHIDLLECGSCNRRWVEDDDGNKRSLTWGEELPDAADELKELEQEAGDCSDADEARERIQEDALSVRIFGERVNGEWEADRFELLLATGGPAVRILGELDGNNEPCRAWIEVQDWGTPWTQYFDADSDVLLAYASCFYYGE